MKKLFGFTLAAALTWSGAAFAQGTDEFGAYGSLEHSRRQESPQSWALEIRFGPYLPSVDDDFPQSRPFETTFGNDNRYMLGFEVDWQVLRIPGFGSFGPGFGWGYTNISADARLRDGTGRAEQETSLSIMPIYLVGVLRVDVLAREVGIPLVPYAKVGAGYALWWVGDGEETANENGVEGRGASYGYQYALGGMLLLDFFDEGSAIEIENTSGVNNSYFFAEWYVSTLDGFGSGNRMNVGANTWFTLGVETGLLSVVSVLASLYPVTTVLLARALLGERLGAIQAAGVTIALTGVALIAAG